MTTEDDDVEKALGTGAKPAIDGDLSKPAPREDVSPDAYVPPGGQDHEHNENTPAGSPPAGSQTPAGSAEGDGGS